MADNTCKLRSCNKVIKGHPNKKFCSDKHRFKYHNVHNPRGIALQRVVDIEDTMHPQDPYSLGQE
jgi:hypothetical protein